MHSRVANVDLWPRVREFAVPPLMIESATARRLVGDWAGACAAAHVDVDLNLRAVGLTYGSEFVARVRDDLRHLAPDLLRWHMPRIAPDGLLRPGITLTLARYQTGDPNKTGGLYETGGPDEAGGRYRTGGRGVHLVAWTPPAWADAGQRIGLALWDGSGTHPDRRFRLDLHRHLWDVRRTGELRVRSGADDPRGEPVDQDPVVAAARRCGGAVDRWASEAALLVRSDGYGVGAVAIRLGARQRLVFELDTGRLAVLRGAGTLPVLPDAAVWVQPDLELLRRGLIGPAQLHPLVAEALVPGYRVDPRPGPDRTERPRLVECRGVPHRIGLVDGVLTALDHDPAEIRREELLAALTGTPLACFREIDRAHRQPACLDEVRAHLDHGNNSAALDTVEGLLGTGAVLRDGELWDELETAVQRQVAYGLFRAGLGPVAPPPDRRTDNTANGNTPRRGTARRSTPNRGAPRRQAPKRRTSKP